MESGLLMLNGLRAIGLRRLLVTSGLRPTFKYAMKYAPTYRLGRYAVPRAERVLEYGPDAKLLNLVLWVKALN